MIQLNLKFRLFFTLILASTHFVQASPAAIAIAQTDGPQTPDQVAVVPAGFTDATVTDISGNATGLELLPDGRLLITAKAGQLIVLQNGVQSIALDLATEGVLCSGFERGLQSVVADPGFAGNSFIYVFYTRRLSDSCDQSASSPVRSRVVRYTLSPTNTVSAPFVVLENIPSPCGNHNGGDLHFGPQDGLLYISVGDGGCDNSRARYASTLSGKILRVTKDGSIPASNPYANDANGVLCGSLTAQPLNNTTKCKEIFATGLRNPFRFAMKHGSNNEFYINDVGQSTWEEISVGAIGADYGWNVREGKCLNGSSSNCPAPPAGMTDPIHVYSHSLGCSITGGAFAVSSVWPTQYNSYYFADYCDGNIYQLIQGNSVTSQTFSVRGGAVVNLMFDPVASALYYTLDTGEVRKITYTDTNNRAPTALATAAPTSGIAPFAVTFNGAASSDPDAGDMISYDWNFGDGAPHATTITTTHAYTRSGVFTATLIVTDDKGLASVPWQQKIQANNTPPTAMITAPISITKFAVGQVVTLTGKGTDPQDGTLAGSKLAWQVLLHHISTSNPQNKHTHPYAIGTGTTLSLTYPGPEDLDAAAGSYVEARLTATDAQGLTGTMTQTLQPMRVTITVSAVSTQTAAYGLNAYVNGVEVVERQTFTGWQGWSLALSAPAFQQDLYAFWFRFGAWADGGTAAHTVTVPANGATYTAYYVPSEKPNWVWLPLVVK